MTARLITVGGVAPTPWRNGGGRTRELLTWPDATDWAWRISVADIEADGPFSDFPGVQRWFAVIEGGPLALEFASHRELLDTDSPACRFDGGKPPFCRLLNGPTRDLNLMVRRGKAVLAPAVANDTWKTPAVSCGFFSRVAGVLHRGDGGRQAMPALSLLWLGEQADETVRFEPDLPGPARVGWRLAVSGS